MRREATFWLAVGALFLVPAAHPMLRPLIGVPSHLLWWVHVLPVAIVSYRLGRRGAVAALVISALLVGIGERTFGAGYGAAADWDTAWALASALTFTNILLSGFALYARQAAKRYQVLFDLAISGVIRTDGAMRVEAANPAALRLLRVDWETIRWRRLDELPQLHPLPRPEEIAAHGWSGSVLVGHDGHDSEVHLVVAAVAHDDPTGYQLLLVDRTQEVVQQREMDRQGHLATLGEGMAGVAHELRNPLTVITAWASLGLAPGASAEDMREGLDTIRAEAERMANLIQEMLGFSRTHDDGARVHVDDLLSRLLRIQRLTRRKSVRVAERILWRGEATLPGARVEQILVNLLSNATDALPPGGGEIEVTLREEGGDVILEVSDNGPGIPAELWDRIFDPFVTTKPEGKGTGLGLAVSRRLAISMGGSLSAGSGSAGGALFTLRLPKHPAPGAGIDVSRDSLVP